MSLFIYAYIFYLCLVSLNIFYSFNTVETSITLAEAQIQCEDSPRFRKNKNMGYAQWTNFIPVIT